MSKETILLKPIELDSNRLEKLFPSGLIIELFRMWLDLPSNDQNGREEKKGADLFDQVDRVIIATQSQSKVFALLGFTIYYEWCQQSSTENCLVNSEFCP